MQWIQPKRFKVEKPAGDHGYSKSGGFQNFVGQALRLPFLIRQPGAVALQCRVDVRVAREPLTGSSDSKSPAKHTRTQAFFASPARRKILPLGQSANTSQFAQSGLRAKQ